jgi:hypothetical protein
MKPGLLESFKTSYSTQRLPCSENTYLARRTLSMEQLFSQGLSNGDCNCFDIGLLLPTAALERSKMLMVSVLSPMT